MRFFSLYRVELRRLLLTKFIWLISALCLCSPLLGYTVYKPVTLSETMSGLYIGNPVLAGTAAGAVLWAVLAVFEADRQRRSGTDILADSAAPPTAHSAAKTAALMTISAAVTLLCALVYIPFTAVKLEYLFDAGFYFMNFFVFMLPTWWISILFADGLYRITRRVELSAVLYAALAYMSYSRFAESNWFMQWLNPTIGAYSDGFPDRWFLRMGAYTRLVWLCISAGVWAFSLICTRKYQKGLGGSFVRGLKKVYLPVGAAALAAAGTILWSVQPFIGHGSYEYDLENEYEFMENHFTALPATAADFSLKFDTVLGTLSGRAEYQLTETAKGENVLRMNAGYKIKSMTYGGEPVSFRTVKEDINGKYDTYFELPDKNYQKLIIEYGGFLTAARCGFPMVTASIGSNYIRLQNTDCIPSLGNYIANKAELEVTLPDDLIPFINSERKQLTDFTDNGDGTRTYRTPLDTSFIYEFVAGRYVTDKFSSDYYDFKFIYGETYRSAVEEYDVHQTICDVFDYCTEHYGKPHYIGGGSFTLFQLSSLTMSGYAVSGTSTWLEDAISPNTLSDRNRGINATEVFLHEMIHQWWGGVGMWCDDSDGVWSAEGLTVYTTYRIVKEKYGELYAKQYYVDNWKKYVDEQNRNFYNRHPKYLEKLPERYREQLSALNKSVNQYKRMPLMLLKAEELLGGEEQMDAVLKRMFTDYNSKGEQYALTYKEFLDYCGLTEEDLKLD